MKHRNRLTVAAAALSLMAVPALAACSSGAETETAADCVPEFGTFETITEGKLALATYDGMPYFGQAGGEQEGIDADFLNWFAEASCLVPEWTVSPSAAVIQSVASDRADIAAGGWYATPERGEVAALSAPSYLEIPAIFGMTETENIEDLRGKKVGTVTGYLWVDELKSVSGELNEYQSTDAVLTDLAQGRLDYAVLGSIDAPYLVETNKQFADIKPAIMAPTELVESSMNPQLPNYPHTKGNTELTAALDKALAKAQEDGSFAEIMTTYGLDASLVEVNK